MVHTGDILLDTLNYFLPLAHERSDVICHLGLEKERFWLMTMHRPCNVDEVETLKKVLASLAGMDHPRIAKTLKELSVSELDFIRIIPPVAYLDMLTLEENAELILTDSE